MALYKNRGTPVWDKEGVRIMRNETFEAERLDPELLLRRAHQFRQVSERPNAPKPRRERVMNVPPEDAAPENDGGPDEFDGTYNIDDMHTGSGWYTLPRGHRERGRDAALAKLAELTGLPPEELQGGDSD